MRCEIRRVLDDDSERSERTARWVLLTSSRTLNTHKAVSHVWAPAPAQHGTDRNQSPETSQRRRPPQRSQHRFRHQNYECSNSNFFSTQLNETPPCGTQKHTRHTSERQPAHHKRPETHTRQNDAKLQLRRCSYDQESSECRSTLAIVAPTQEW